ncbi:hypothetical protein O9G_004859, partial [Rozella allomycis CSF55]
MSDNSESDFESANEHSDEEIQPNVLKTNDNYQQAPASVSPKENDEVNVVNNANANSWFSWGSSFVKTIGENIKDSVDKVYDKLDDSGKGIDYNPVANPTELILNGLDKTFDFASDTLGSVFLSGMRKVEEVNLSDISEKAGKIVESIQKPEDVEVVNQGLNMLELIGKKTIGIISEKTGLDSQKPRAVHNRSDSAPKSAFDNLLEDSCCKANFQALQMLSNETSIKLKGYELKDENIQQMFLELDDIFDMDALLDDIKDSDSSILDSEESFIALS